MARRDDPSELRHDPDLSLTDETDLEAGASAGPLAEETDGFDSPETLVSDESAVDYRNRWDTIQANFIDEPRRSVEEADRMVSEVIEGVTRTFQEQRASLERQWEGEGVSTEDLRVALRRYRTFFERLLTT